jgi:hypothetical protein
MTRTLFRMAPRWWAASALALTLAACTGPAASTASAPAPSSAATAPSATAGQTSAADGTTVPPACPSTGGSVVSSAAELAAALKSAAPGQTILLAPGTYSGHFVASTSGTQAQPIVLCGPRSAVLNGGSIKSGYTFHLEHADWWKVEGFTIEGGQKGLVADMSDHDLIDGLSVHSIGDEGIHLRDFSSSDTVSHNLVSNTGLNVSFYGEGIYIGSAHKNWCRYSGCQVDRSDNNIIADNIISATTAENIDIKEGTTGGLITGNHFNGSGMDPSSATSWVNVKGNDWKIIGNTGVDSIQDGLSNHQVYAGWGLDNVFADNKLIVNGPGYGINIAGKRLNADVSCNNQVIGAARGMSSIDCTPS